MPQLKLCVNCEYGESQYSIGMKTYVKCDNSNNKHPQRSTPHNLSDTLLAMVDLECWTPKKE